LYQGSWIAFGAVPDSAKTFENKGNRRMKPRNTVQKWFPGKKVLLSDATSEKSVTAQGGTPAESLT
jgi:hypothetical protein